LFFGAYVELSTEYCALILFSTVQLYDWLNYLSKSSPLLGRAFGGTHKVYLLNAAVSGDIVPRWRKQLQHGVIYSVRGKVCHHYSGQPALTLMKPCRDTDTVGRHMSYICSKYRRVLLAYAIEGAVASGDGLVFGTFKTLLKTQAADGAKFYVLPVLIYCGCALLI
jgi:hypothetical protein